MVILKMIVVIFVIFIVVIAFEWLDNKMNEK